MKSHARHWIEYAMLRLVTGSLNALPYRGALGVGWGLAVISRPIARTRLREAARRIQELLGDSVTDEAARRMANRAWRNFIFSGIEGARSSRMDRDGIRAVSDAETSLLPLIEHARTGRGAILAGPHMGSWELAGVAARLYGIPVFSIAGRQRNPFFDSYLNRLREAAGMKMIVRGSGTLRQALRSLRAGEVMAILPDVRMPTPDQEVIFFGRRANVGSGMALLAYHADVPIFPCMAVRQGWSRHRFHLFPPIHPHIQADKESECHRLTAEVFRFIENAIREYPDQWFWFNRRWILDPVAPPLESA